MDESRCDTARMKINISWTENHKNKNISFERGVIVKKFREWNEMFEIKFCSMGIPEVRPKGWRHTIVERKFSSNKLKKIPKLSDLAG